MLLLITPQTVHLFVYNSYTFEHSNFTKDIKYSNKNISILKGHMGNIKFYMQLSFSSELQVFQVESSNPRWIPGVLTTMFVRPHSLISAYMSLTANFYILSFVKNYTLSYQTKVPFKKYVMPLSTPIPYVTLRKDKSIFAPTPTLSVT